MRLSEAIRLGSMISPQRTGGYMDNEGRCALASACDAAGIPPEVGPFDERPTVNYDAMQARWSWLSIEVECPRCALTRPFVELIWHLNDFHLLTREQIADWVETVEPRDNERVELATPTNAVREETGEPVVSIRASVCSS